MYFLASASMCASAPCSVSSARPRTWTYRYGLSGSCAASATCGWRWRFLSFTRPRAVLNRMYFPSKSTHTGVICGAPPADHAGVGGLRRRSEEHTSELQSPDHLVCRLLLEKKKTTALRYNL